MYPYINAIRRTILSDIPTLVFNCFPHDKMMLIFISILRGLNNEILKQRLSCIPIHISDLDLSIQGVDSGNQYEK